ncbi:MAG: hypothetical protein IT342_18025 [Candidatus Melainabacteria bacterium]|nr:hypothetical protein [Candidatus Melainabacteria bacterium]
MSIERFFDDYIGFDITAGIDAGDWLSFPAQKLRTITGGKVFHDDIRLAKTRRSCHSRPADQKTRQEAIDRQRGAV